MELSLTSTLPDLDRRRFSRGAAGLLSLAPLGGLGLAAGCAERPAGGLASEGPQPLVKPLRVSLDRLFDYTVCLRPFRAAGPRLDVEEVGGARVVHNYGHGGSGWSLSWGSGAVAVARAMETSPRRIAVVGSGAIGLTSAILAQHAGAEVTIYARDLLPDARSARATGSWTPDSRIALASVAGPAFADLWESMARRSFKTYRNYLGLPGSPVEWTDRFSAFDGPGPGPKRETTPGGLDFADYEDRIRDLTPRNEAVPPERTPFRAPVVMRSQSMTFNIPAYGRRLMDDFLLAGGRFVRREFKSPQEIGALPERVVINCPGFEARTLWNDASVVPVRGQISWLTPQTDALYGVYWRGISLLSRRDGIVVQDLRGGDMRGYGDAEETVDRHEGEEAVRLVSGLFAPT
jgi:glycine/D-amino acid oxidase-like deaminating enzyme